MAFTRPMLATLADEPFDRDGWVYEEKYDGIRIIAERKRGQVRFYTRNLIERDLPGIAAEVAALPGGDLVLDGEVLHGSRLVYAVFDCLLKDGRSLMKRPLHERRAAFEPLVAKRKHLMASRRLEGGGLAAYETAKREGWEGIVAKDESSLYEPGERTRAWLKVKVVKESDFVVGGYTPPAGTRAHFGAILIGVFDEGGLRFAGKVGSGFGSKSLQELKCSMDRSRVAASPFRDAPRFKKVVWVEPVLVCKVRFMEWTGDGKLRHPVFLGLRDDKDASEVTWSTREQ